MLSLRRRGSAILASLVFLAACADQTLPTESGSPAATPAAVSSADVPDLTSGVPLGKTDVCHRRGRGDYIVINVSQNAVPAHRAHGDGLPGEPVPGESSVVFDAACVPTLVCTYSNLELEPDSFDETGGQGTITYLMSSAACECSGTSAEPWVTIANPQVSGNVCSLDAIVAEWEDPLISRSSLVETPAGSVLVDQATDVIIIGPPGGGGCGGLGRPTC